MSTLCIMCTAVDRLSTNCRPKRGTAASAGIAHFKLHCYVDDYCHYRVAVKSRRPQHTSHAVDVNSSGASSWRRDQATRLLRINVGNEQQARQQAVGVRHPQAVWRDG